RVVRVRSAGREEGVVSCPSTTAHRRVPQTRTATAMPRSSRRGGMAASTPALAANTLLARACRPPRRAPLRLTRALPRPSPAPFLVSRRRLAPRRLLHPLSQMSLVRPAPYPLSHTSRRPRRALLPPSPDTPLADPACWTPPSPCRPHNRPPRWPISR